MDNDKNTDPKRQVRRCGSHMWSGFLLLAIGVLLLLRQFGFQFPNWLFTWQMLLIAIGLFMGIRHKFRGIAWLLLVILGATFLLADQYSNVPVHKFIWPVFIIIVGILFIFRPRYYRRGGRWRDWRNYYRNEVIPSQDPNAGNPTSVNPASENFSKEDYLDTTAVFGGVKKIVLSKNFRGGDITNFMGGTEINLTQADIQQEVRIDTTTIFGGTKLIIPASWDVKSEVVALFGGVEDKRDIHSITHDPKKVLILDGTCIFGGIEIRSY